MEFSDVASERLKLGGAFRAIIVTCLPAMAQESFIDTYADDIEAMLSDQFADSSGGMVIGLIDETGSRVWSKGRLDNGTDHLVDGDTVFEIGSVTKVFTTLLALDMDRRGEVRLDDPVSKYLPERVKVPITMESKSRCAIWPRRTQDFRFIRTASRRFSIGLRGSRSSRNSRRPQMLTRRTTCMRFSRTTGWRARREADSSTPTSACLCWDTRWRCGRARAMNRWS